MPMDDRLESAEAWKKAVEWEVTDTEWKLWDLVDDYGSCLVCGKEFASLAAHLWSKKHWTCLGNHLHWQWPQDGSEPVQKWAGKDGSTFFYNHLTAAHGIVQELPKRGRRWGKPRTEEESPTEEKPASRPCEEAPSLAAPSLAAPSLAAPSLASAAAVTQGDDGQGKPAAAARKAAELEARLPEPEAEVSDEWSKINGKEYANANCSEAKDKKKKKEPKAEPPVQDGLPCADCGKALARESFSTAQQKRGPQRRCKACVERVQEQGSLPPTCCKCKQQKEWGDFRKKIDWERPKCRQCLEEEETGASLTKCNACHERLPRSSFRQRVDWDNPRCRECTEGSERCEHEERLRQYQEEVQRQQQMRDEMDEAALKGELDARIVGPAKELFGRLPCQCSQVSFRGAEFNRSIKALLGSDRFRWADRLAECVQDAMDLSRLSTTWSRETPSRCHASDEGAADQFKQLEDEGDRLVQDLAGRLFERFVLGEEIVRCSREELLRVAEPLDEKRSCCWRGRGKVIVAVKPLEPWRDTEGLRAEPRCNRFHPGPDMFAQLDLDAKECLHRVLLEGENVEVKLYDKSYWQGLEQSLYEGRSEAGSHNQTFKNAYGIAGGTSSGANRTEVMNMVADMLGFHDQAKHAPDSAWKELHGPLLPPRLRVVYGSGAEFKADTKWRTKREANVLEALVGALWKADLKELAWAVAGLCFLTYLAPPLGVLPSNWAMAEKVVLLARAEEYRHDLECKHLNAEAFHKQMEKWLEPPVNSHAPLAHAHAP